MGGERDERGVGVGGCKDQEGESGREALGIFRERGGRGPRERGKEREADGKRRGERKWGRPRKRKGVEWKHRDRRIEERERVVKLMVRICVRQTDRQTDRDRNRERQREIETDTQTHRQIDRHRHREGGGGSDTDLESEGERERVGGGGGSGDSERGRLKKRKRRIRVWDRLRERGGRGGKRETERD